MREDIENEDEVSIWKNWYEFLQTLFFSGGKKKKEYY